MSSLLDAAIEELRLTIELALHFDEQQVKFSSILQSHIDDIEEDYTALQSLPAVSEEDTFKKEAALKEARCAKRALRKTTLLQKETEQAAAATRASAPSNSFAHSDKPKSDSRLQRLEIPIFFGEPSKFRAFYDLYVENVESDDKLSPMAKWAHLDRSLGGEAQQLVSKIPRLPEMRATALKMLKDSYDSVEKTTADLFAQIMHLPASTMQDKQLRMTQAHLEGLLLSLEALGHNVNSDVNLKNQVASKFPKEFLHLIIPTAADNDLQRIRVNLHAIISAREAVGNCLPTTTPPPPPSTTRSTPAASKPARQQRPPKCVFCSQAHWSDECPVYTTIEARLQRIPDRCARCLRYKHEGPCATTRRCAVCDDPGHNRAFCPKKFAAKAESALFTVDTHVPQQHPVGGAYLTFTLLVATADSSTHVSMRAVIDTAAGKTCITKPAAEKIGLQPNNSLPITFAGLNGVQLQKGVLAATPVQLLPQNESPILVSAYITDDIAVDLPAARRDEFYAAHPNLSHIKIPPTGEGAPIDILFAADTLPRLIFLDQGVVVDSTTQLLATRFGHVIMGPRSDERAKTIERQLFLTAESDAAVARMWEFDAVGLKEIESTDAQKETAALEKFYSTISFTGERYEVGWPFVDENPALEDNFALSWGRLKSLWKKLNANKQLLHDCNEIIQTQIANGIVEIVPEDNKKTSSITHYIPHHPVVKATNASTKVRLVYDASAKSSHKSRSLNETLHTGTRWVADIFTHLLRFRRFKCAITADIAQAFLQIAIRPADRDAARFLWLKDVTKQPSRENLLTLRFTRVAFGIVSSPFLLFATIAHHLKTNYPEAEHLILDNLYADNIVASLPDSLPAAQFHQQVKEIFSTMGMNMTKWVSTDATFIASLPPSDRLSDTTQSVLGLRWNTATDSLSIRKPQFQALPQNHLTKRHILRQMASTFDPMGFAVPIILKARLFVRELWAQQLGWDDNVQQQTHQQWQTILTDLRETDTIILRRQFFANAELHDMQHTQMHSFVDASADATAVVVYITATIRNETHVSLVAAKARLVPKNRLSIPRLELLALLLGVRFTKYIIDALKWPLSLETHLWSDSACVLAWTTNNKILPAIITKQINEINEFSRAQLHHVPSELNFADIASRGGTLHELRQLNWWAGPQWLANKSTWPQQPACIHSTPTHLHTLFLTDEPASTHAKQDSFLHLKPENFSTLAALLRRSAYVLRAINTILKQEILPLQTHLDYRYAEKLWLRWDQQQHYPLLFKNPHKQKKLGNIRYYIDDDNIIRCQSRLQNTALESDAIEPILLAKNSTLTKLIIIATHSTHGHAGAQQTLALLRQRFWLPHGRRETQRTIRTYCMRCRRFAAQPFPPPAAAPLPEFRVSQSSRPFEAVGVDIFGPYAVRTLNIKKAPRIKKWILIFTCAVVRAVHLETVTELTTQAILEAFRRFAARRGVPTIILSDNAPHFHALDSKFQDIWKTLTQQPAASSYFANHKIVWKFITPHSPWMGGMYERLIGSIKLAFEKTYGLTVMLERQFDTSIIEIEAVLNQRPITYVEKSIDAKLITPMDFLQARFPAVSLDSLPATSDNLLLLWKASQQTLQTFWQHWSQLFLMTLRERDDHLKAQNKTAQLTPQPEDLVIILQPKEKRSAWRLAVLEQLITSDDGQSRSALLRLSDNSKLIKPLTQLAPLELNTGLQPSAARLTPDRSALIVDEREGTVSITQQHNTQTTGDNGSDTEDDAEVIEYEFEISDWEDDDTPENATKGQGTDSSGEGGSPK